MTNNHTSRRKTARARQTLHGFVAWALAGSKNPETIERVTELGQAVTVACRIMTLWETLPEDIRRQCEEEAGKNGVQLCDRD